MTGSIQQVAEGGFAYLQLPGTWGYSNSGLICDRGQALVVDTLYDARLTADMLDAYRRIAGATPLETVVNTHANGDHCWGNQLLPDAQVVSTRSAAEEMGVLPPRSMQALVHACRAIAAGGKPLQGLLRMLGRLGSTRAAALAEAAPFVARHFGEFDFGGVTLRLPDRTFEGELELRVGDKTVHLVEVGPAHTRGDLLVHVPADRLVFTGDILFEGSHPVIWEGPIENWIAACDRILAMDVETVVPGHGPLAGPASLRRLRSYLVELRDRARAAYDAGVGPREAAAELQGALEPEWGESERLAANVATLYRQFSGAPGQTDPVRLLAEMARLG